MLTRQKRNFYKVLFVFGVDTKNINVIFLGGEFTLWPRLEKTGKGLRN